MTDQITFSLRKDTIKERSQLIVTVNFRTRATASATTPTNVRYRLDCLSTGKEIADWTAATPGTTATITISPDQNAIQGDGLRERKQLTVAADYGLSTQYTETLEYWVQNIRGIP